MSALGRYSDKAHTALFVELAAALGPMLFVFLIGLLWWGGEQPAGRVGKAARVPAATGEAVPQRGGTGSILSVCAPACVRSIFDGQIVETTSGRIGAGELYKAYEASCAGKPVSQNKIRPDCRRAASEGRNALPGLYWHCFSRPAPRDGRGVGLQSQGSRHDAVQVRLVLHTAAY